MLNKTLKSNFISGLLVFLIALPLCLGIAKASDFPPIAGIYTAIIGGLIVTFMSNAQLAIKGPAAGLIAIAVNAVDELGKGDLILGYKLTLAVIVISGIIQIVMGLIKFGKLGDFFPVSVIHGMLAAIGVIIISKQIHIVMGVVPISKSPFDLLAEIPSSIAKINPEVAIIGFLSLALLFVHPLIKKGFIKKLPAPLLVLAIAIPLGYLFNLSHSHDYDIGSLHFHIDPAQSLVALPDSFLSGITLPDFSQLLSYTSFKYIAMFALVGSIESILSAKAIDSLDPKGRKTNLNQDLIAVGIGNTLAGMIGGLPMISEIVRSSANINNGAKSKMSNFFHGLFLFLFVLLAATIIKTIPNAALAAMLVYTGFKLASPKEFKKVNKIGLDQILQFLTTLIVTLFTDLLIGVVAGIALKIVIELIQGVRVKEMFKLETKVSSGTDGLVVQFSGIASFINYLKFKSFIDTQPRNQKITLDFNDASFIDHTFLNNIHQMQNEFSKKGGELIKTGFEHHHFISKHHLATRKRVLNPAVEESQETWSKREIAMNETASRHQMDFELTPSPSLIRPYLSSFSILSKFRRANNFLIGIREHYNVMICDITYDSIDDFSKKTSKATIGIIYNIAKGGIPDFYTDKNSSLFNINRYDFEPFVESKTMPFNIYGKNEELLSNFFNSEIVNLIGDHKYDLECHRRVILLHKGWKRLSTGKDLDQFISFVDELGEKIVEKRLTDLELEKN